MRPAVFDVCAMSPCKRWTPAPPRIRSVVDRLGVELGTAARDERTRRGWTLRDVAERSGLSASTVHSVEAGRIGSLEAYVRIAGALGLDAAFSMREPGKASRRPDADLVHAALGEMEARHFRGLGFAVAMDEPYQHYQFAGRADVIVHDPERRALLHIENRTRFPDIQAFAGSFNAKRSYLGAAMAERFLPGRRFSEVAHVVVALWSSEVLHAVRLRDATFRALCPDATDGFGGWWRGEPPASGTTSTFVLFDPLPGKRSTRRRWVGLEDARRVDARYRGYADAADALRRADLG